MINSLQQVQFHTCIYYLQKQIMIIMIYKNINIYLLNQSVCENTSISLNLVLFQKQKTIQFIMKQALLDNYYKELNLNQLYSVRSLKKTPFEKQNHQNYFVPNILSPKNNFSNRSSLKGGDGLVVQKLHRSQNNSRILPDIQNGQRVTKNNSQPYLNQGQKKQYKIQIEPLEEEHLAIPYLRMNFRLKYGYKKQNQEKKQKNSIENDDLKLQNNKSVNLFREKQKDFINKVQMQVQELLLKENEQLSFGFDKLERELLQQMK
ncbi:unnamed protein product [Paramecium primaurelia]|uniref:Uncharacterized protein n=1 Tax=Paramecium primaurelia TaxID=5886 RepID=A0A8S1K4Y2_PARPR|nr:unnamed protein product [Paramecium primaurelia]